MADFQYVSADRRPPESCGPRAAERVGPYGPETEPLLVVPPSFSRVDLPLDYAFRGHHAAGDAAKGARPSF
jgi:hypothetical protein